MTVLTAVFMICAMISVIPASANKSGGYLGDVPATDVEIKIDGEKDSIYEQGLKVDIKYEKDKEVRATGVVTLLFSNGTVYAFAEVKDDEVQTPLQSNRENAPWRTDSFEVFINLPNNNNIYDIMQYRIDCDGWPSVYDKNGLQAYGPTAASKYFKYAAKRVSGGYVAEFAVPADAAGQDIGVNFQINDTFGPESELTWAVVYSEAMEGGTDSWSVNIYPYLSLGKTSVSLPTEVPATDVPATEVPATEVPATDVPATDVPATDVPATDVPATDAPVTEAPATDENATAVPATDVPATAEPATAEPATDAPATDEPATGAPADDPATEAPATDKPETATKAPDNGTKDKDQGKNNTGLIVGIVIAAVAVAVIAAVVIIAAKNKKKNSAAK